MDKNINEYLELLKQVYNQNMPFNRTIGFTVEEVSLNQATARIKMQESLVGNTHKSILHGGVISAALDTIGGVAAGAGLLQATMGLPIEEITQRFVRMGTIDLRVDYLRPGQGDYFTARGEILRTGQKIAVTRMELHNDQQSLIAIGTATYMVG